MADNQKTHILIIPYPAQGHIIPLLDLIHNLASTSKLTITIVITPKNLPLISPLVSLFPFIVTPLVLPFPSYHGIPRGKENTKDLPPASFKQIMPAFAKLMDPIRHWFESHPSPPVAIISDIFLGWTHNFALQLGIHRIVFSPSGAFGLSVIYSLWKNMPKKKNQDQDENDVVLFEDVPGCPKFPWWQLSPVFRSYVEGDADSEFIKQGFWDDMASWGMLINSFDDMEKIYLDHLSSSFGYDGRIWAVGPLVSQNKDENRGGSSSIEVDKLKSWLDTCQDNEVVYVSFGTQAVLTNRQMEVIAEGLEKSRVRFIWSVKDQVGDHGMVPHGFEDRLSGRGLVIKGWAPQVLILKHPTVGAFLTHCGWNSVLEGVVAGVKLLAWPMGADQFSNATLIVNHLKVGTRVCEGSDMVLDSCELARILAESVNQDEISREKIMKLQSKALESLSDNGSSSKALVRLVNKLCELKIEPKIESISKGNNHLE
ncbi:unnamed protein product [Amaranthus hypochondriacus]